MRPILIENLTKFKDWQDNVTQIKIIFMQLKQKAAKSLRKIKKIRRRKRKVKVKVKNRKGIRRWRVLMIMGFRRR